MQRDEIGLHSAAKRVVEYFDDIEQNVFYENETRKHILLVGDLLLRVVMELTERIKNHDKSKFDEAERKLFAEMTQKLEKTMYGDEAYKAFLRKLGPALQHHYCENRHHPEHFNDGIEGMNLIDLLEMICDWIAATKRHEDGDIVLSLEKNKKRFDISLQLFKILENTVKFLEE